MSAVRMRTSLPWCHQPLGLCFHSLLERRDLWRKEAEARQRSQPDPSMPPGHTLMPESQRLETLNNLLQSENLGKGG